jgi:signal peptidase I
MIKTVLWAVLIALGIRTVLVEPFNIPSGSMMPTLLVGDFLFVSKYSYGYSQYSLPLAFPPFSGRIFGRSPSRGDVAVFRPPSNLNENYIKRVIGLPGDHIQVRGGQLYINGDLVPRTAAGQCNTADQGPPEMGDRFEEVLPGGVRHMICKRIGAADNPANNTREYVVPGDNLFMMGDNRDNSSDSRFEAGGFGTVPMPNLVGRAEFLFFSVDAAAPWWQVWLWPAEIRWGRLFSGVH